MTDAEKDERMDPAFMEQIDVMVQKRIAESDRRAGILHKGGVHWGDAPLPRRWHRCQWQTLWAAPGKPLIERCACGARRYGRGKWEDKNERRTGKSATTKWLRTYGPEQWARGAAKAALEEKEKEEAAVRASDSPSLCLPDPRPVIVDFLVSNQNSIYPWEQAHGLLKALWDAGLRIEPK